MTMFFFKRPGAAEGLHSRVTLLCNLMSQVPLAFKEAGLSPPGTATDILTLGGLEKPFSQVSHPPHLWF